eukprot:1342352-Prymnesium_polylepis.2
MPHGLKSAAPHSASWIDSGVGGIVPPSTSMQAMARAAAVHKKQVESSERRWSRSRVGAQYIRSRGPHFRRFANRGSGRACAPPVSATRRVRRPPSPAPRPRYSTCLPMIDNRAPFRTCISTLHTCTCCTGRRRPRDGDETYPRLRVSPAAAAPAHPRAPSAARSLAPNKAHI